MRPRDLGTWVVLLLVPAIPVFLFYLVFKESNFVELNEVPSGIIATGPIAAYFVLLYIGWRIGKGIITQRSPLSVAEEKLVGTSWSFVAKSQHDSRQGKLSFDSDDLGRLCLSGSFQKDGRDVGSWRSTMVRCENGRLEIVYDLRDSGKGHVRESTGLLSMAAEPDDGDKMSGSWAVFGDSDAFGDLKCERIRS